MAFFRSRMARFAVFAGLAITGLPFLPGAVLFLGDCTGSGVSGWSCGYIPDFVGNLFVGISVMMTFLMLVLVLPILGLLVLLAGLLMEIVTRWPAER